MSDIDLPALGDRLAQGDLDRLVQRLHRATAWRTATAELTGQGRGRDVVAVVDARGVLRSLDVPDVACTGDGARLADDIVRAVTAAREDVAAQLTRSGRATFGEDAPEVSAIDAAATARSRAPIVGSGETDGEGGNPATAPAGTPATAPRSSNPGQW